MTSGKLSGRLARVEATLKAQKASGAPGFFEADLEAGVWREVLTGRLGPALWEGEALEALREAGGGLLHLPKDGAAKVYPGLFWGDL